MKTSSESEPFGSLLTSMRDFSSERSRQGIIFLSVQFLYAILVYE